MEEIQSLFFLGGAEQSKNEPNQMIVLEWLFLTIAPCDAAEPWQLGSQDAATPIMQGITDLHHDVFFFVILILVFVSWILGRALWHFHYKKNPIPQRIVHGTTIEILRTIFPSIIPMFIAIPSFALLYSMDEVVVDPAITIKAIGDKNKLNLAVNFPGVLDYGALKSYSSDVKQSDDITIVKTTQSLRYEYIKPVQ